MDFYLFSGSDTWTARKMWTYSSVDIPGARPSRMDRLKIYMSECVVCFCIVFFIVCVGLLLYLFFHLYTTINNNKIDGNLAESWFWPLSLGLQLFVKTEGWFPPKTKDIFRMICGGFLITPVVLSFLHSILEWLGNIYRYNSSMQRWTLHLKKWHMPNKVCDL